MTRRPVVALDCRWLGIGGAGSVTASLLASLRMLPPDRPVDWRFWDPNRPGRAAGAQRDVPPTRLFGQAHLLAQPRSCDLVCFMHQIRPLFAPRNVTVMHDTTPLRYAPKGLADLKRLFFRRVAATSAMVITVSDWSRCQLVEDLGVPWEKIVVIPNVVGREPARRVRREREKSGPGDYALHVGGLAPHKNAERLIRAFASSDFKRHGGRLILTGCQDAAVADLSRTLSPAELVGVTFLPRCPQEDLDRLYARARFVVQPSLEEGFGLPAREALSAGLPVIGSTAGALAEVSDQFLTCFDPLSVEDMSAALDSAAERTARFDVAEERDRAARFWDAAPSLAGYASMFERAFLQGLGE